MYYITTKHFEDSVLAPVEGESAAVVRSDQVEREPGDGEPQHCEP
jgi:hypothetical protein